MTNVTIITPIYNPNEKYLIQVIRSVQRQTYVDYEHLIIDDKSDTALSSDVLSLIESDPKIRLIKRDWNAGPAVTRNRGISEAKGRFIAFLDADDEWQPNKLLTQINFMLDNHVALCYTAYNIVNEQGAFLALRVPPKKLTYHDILKSNRIGCLTAIYDTNMVGKVFMPNIAKRQDMGLWLSILKKVPYAVGLVDEPYADYRIGGQSVSSNKMSVLKYQWRIYREVEKMSLVTSAYYFVHYVFNGLVRK